MFKCLVNDWPPTNFEKRSNWYTVPKKDFKFLLLKGVKWTVKECMRAIFIMTLERGKMGGGQKAQTQAKKHKPTTYN